MCDSNITISCCIAAAIGVMVYIELRFRAMDDELDYINDKLDKLEKEPDGLWC